MRSARSGSRSSPRARSRRARRSRRSRRASTSSSPARVRTRSGRCWASSAGTGTALHNQIPKPDRSVDNTTIWTADFSQPYYEDLLFDDAAGQNSMRNFYKEQSSNRYTVNGDVTELGAGAQQRGVLRQQRVRLDRLLGYLEVRQRLGRRVGRDDRPPTQANAYLAQFDVWDRYDYDGDGNFNEPDGYIDHFQSIHAGDGRGSRRRRAGHECDLVAPLVRVLPRLSGRARRRRAPRFPGCAHRHHELLDRRLHDRARERRCRRVLARVRARPRPAGRVRHVGQHRRRRELHRLVDTDVAGLVRHADRRPRQARRRT